MPSTGDSLGISRRPRAGELADGTVGPNSRFLFDEAGLC